MDVMSEKRYEDEWNETTNPNQLFIMKRSGERVPFDLRKIINAVSKANKEMTNPVDKLPQEAIDNIAVSIEKQARNLDRDLSVEEIQDKVEDLIMASEKFALARAYITYRYKHNEERKKSTLDKKIEGIINVKVNKDGTVSGGNEEVNQENSNKDTKVLSVQRDYMAGEWSRDYTRKHLLPRDVTQAHDLGLIHVHDTDYQAQPEHNCFSSSTKFVTDEGIMEFGKCKDGQIVNVLDKNGQWRKATVHYYGKQKLYDVTLQSDKNEKKIVCTRNHRWILSDDSVTTNLSINDKLISSNDEQWIVKNIEEHKSEPIQDVWCVEEPITHSFTLDGGIVTGNCCLINLDDMLQNGTCISGTWIDKPKSFSTATTVSSQVIAQVASQQYGGQTISLTHLAPFVDISRQKLRKRYRAEWDEIGMPYTEEQLNTFVEKEVRKEVESGCQTIQYQLITLQTTNGQAPFVTVFMYLNEARNEQEKKDLALLIEVMLEQRIMGVKDASGSYITPAFPKLIYCLQEDNAAPGTKYWYLTELAAKCTAKRMVPDYISEKKMLELKGDVYPCMGCRSFLTPDRFTDKGLGNIANALNYEEGKHKYYGRFNQGVVTLNLVDIACSSGGNEDIFWEIMDERLDLCHKALRSKHERLLGTPSDVAPIQWQYGALARLKPGEVIDPLLFNGYSTISLGYAGLAECVYFMKHTSHTTPEGEEFALSVMQALNDACDTWKAAENIDYSVYGTPLESTTYKFAKCLQKRFGKIPHVTDKNYITNSYHVHVTEQIDAFSKLTKESKFQRLSPGGAISYVEVPNMQGNIPAVLAIIQHIYNTIVYAELNTKSDHCENCGYDGEIKIIHKDGKLAWQCPQCGCTDQNKMHVARRTCGYIGTQYWNQGRTQEIAERVLHVAIDADFKPNAQSEKSE